MATPDTMRVLVPYAQVHDDKFGEFGAPRAGLKPQFLTVELGFRR